MDVIGGDVSLLRGPCDFLAPGAPERKCLVDSRKAACTGVPTVGRTEGARMSLELRDWAEHGFDALSELKHACCHAMGDRAR